MGRRRISTAESVLAQAKARVAATPRTVVPLAPETAVPNARGTASVLHARVDEMADLETGAPRLRVIIPGKKVPEIYDLSRLLVQPEVARFLAEGFRQWATGPVNARTRAAKCRTLNTDVGAFLATLKGQVSLKSIDETFWTSFIVWLNGPRRGDDQPWRTQTRALVFAAFKGCIDALEGHPERGAVATYLKDRSGLPRNLWPGMSTKHVPTPVLSPPERRALILACLGEIRALREHLKERDAILEIGRALLDEARSTGQEPPYHSEIGVCAARIAEAFPHRLASFDGLYAFDRSLGAAVKYKHGMLQVRRLLYATFRDLVPFVVLIGIKTAFNPDTILTLTWSRVRISDEGTTVTFLGVKNRAAGLQASIILDDGTNDCGFPAELGVTFGMAEILALLRRLTERSTAILANVEHADRLFIGVPVGCGSAAKSFDHQSGPSCDYAWKHSMVDFIQHHGLTPFTLQMLRFTEAEREWRRTGDMLAVRDRLGQKSVSTTRTHYTSDGMRRESQERVAETQTLYHRWAETEGRSDPRHQTERCRSAATPGFGCLNPYDSPRPGQRKGKLCSAYGECPDCPLAQSWLQDVQAVALYLALPNAIYDARLGRVSARHWVEKWPPILHALNGLLAATPPGVRAEAARYCFKLKPVG
jgi:hypothetical protein